MERRVVHSPEGSRGGIARGGAPVHTQILGPHDPSHNRYGKPVGDLGSVGGDEMGSPRALVHETVCIGLAADRCRWGWLGKRSSRLEPYMLGLMKGWGTRYCVWARRDVGPVPGLLGSEDPTPSEVASCCSVVSSCPPGSCPPPEVFPCA